MVLGLLSLLAFSCVEDPASSCLLSDWAGSYTGTEECNQKLLDAEIEVTTSGESIVFIIRTSNGSVTLPAADFNRCSASVSVDPLNADATLTGDRLVLGSTLVDAVSGTLECTYVVDRN